MQSKRWRPLRTMAAVAAGLALAAPALAANITLTQISTTFNSPIGIDYYEPNNTVVMSVNYPSGNPHALEEVAFSGAHSQFSALSGVGDEVKIATVRSAAHGGWAGSGFVAGTLFVGNGVDGQIVRITGVNGATVTNPWVDLTGAGNGLMRGSLYVDRTGVWGGDLIAATTAGEVWRITSAGGMTKLADVNVHLEGLVTIPNDPLKYGGMAGKILAGDEGNGRLHWFATNGTSGFWTVPVDVEDLDMIMPNENFFGVNFGTGKILGAAASDFTSMVGDILVTEEVNTSFSPATKLSRLTWDFVNNVPKFEAIGLNPGSAPVGQWEHVTFAAAGIVEIPPVDIPEPGTLVLFACALAGLGLLRSRAA